MLTIGESSCGYIWSAAPAALSRTTIWTSELHCIATAYELIVDDIDGVLARLYGLSVDELDFMIYYDAKYRLSQVTENDQQSPKGS